MKLISNRFEIPEKTITELMKQKCAEYKGTTKDCTYMNCDDCLFFICIDIPGLGTERVMNRRTIFKKQLDAGLL